MAATALTVQPVPHTGLDISYSAPTQTTGHTAPTGQGIALLVKNGGGSPINVDVHLASTATVDGVAGVTPAGGAGPARRIAVTNAHDELIPLPVYPYADPSTGLVTFDVSATTSVSLACVAVS